MNRIKVICAIISFGSRVLVVQRGEGMSMPLKWEFPGGKVEKGESEEACVKREIKEELDIEIKLLKRLTPVRHSYPHVSIELIPFQADFYRGEVNLLEHKQYLLLDKQQLGDLDWADADVPIVNEYMEL
ncbi:(deoxy)nucleoside triphosphate pyrophosphohydrolase [Marinilabilia sp.]|uniref:(deoxy)nucleoside triphosphate pyrophosphohydrolase n=1 Tax=Marinilabilia sp. TaxID=2021252 RepID=UPI0025BEBD20|nr:(deoxy)nucleoside triphosphate pyrophosphohydrolase [Marinilabilia sp.]